MLGPQDAGHAGVATGRGVFSLRSFILNKRPPLFFPPSGIIQHFPHIYEIVSLVLYGYFHLQPLNSC
ncbi:hypothetical protein CYJ37_07560 [Bacillus sp. UMB0728]|nr:hypothetical protein CYJ37_07560 [Bacillus sp. UMB0728]